ncbi:MAG: hypothetical protein HFF18_10675 [Oscillospiraceae bacterium]|nr:hypothetical protein [Oscillospiraceae bacterium]
MAAGQGNIPAAPEMYGTAETWKGKGVSFAGQAGSASHSMAVGQREYESAMADLAEG